MNMTRHNLGMMSLDYAVQKLGLEWTLQKSLGGWVAETTLESLIGQTGINQKVYFLKPTEYMNVNGKSVQRFLNSKKISHQNVILLHDDLEKKLGKVGVKQQGSANGHNGIKSVAEILHTFNFKRIRVGIDRPDNKDEVSSYVLSKFTDAELQQLNQVVYPLVHTIILNLVKEHSKTQI